MSKILVYMLDDVEKVGIKGQLVKVCQGYAKNFLLPQRKAKIVAAGEEKFLKAQSANVQVKKEVIESKAGMLAERIGKMTITVKKKLHDDGKVYGSVSADEIVDALKAKEIIINKKQVEFVKSLRTAGEHTVVIKLSSKLRPELGVKVVSEGKEKAA